MERLYTYVGSGSVLRDAGSQPPGEPIRSRAQLRSWLVTHPEGVHEAATFVVTRGGVLRLAPRRSEHVACASGDMVRAAGEIAFTRDGASVAWCSNQSSGFCPESSTIVSLARALARSELRAPDRYSLACEWRRCVKCRERNLVKDGDFSCAVCDATLPDTWNFADDPAVPPELIALRDAERIELGPSGFAQAITPGCAAWRSAAARAAEVKSSLEWLLLNASPGGRCYAAMLLASIDAACARAATETLRDDETAVLLNPGGGCSYEATTVGAFVTSGLEARSRAVPQ